MLRRNGPVVKSVESGRGKHFKEVQTCNVKSVNVTTWPSFCPKNHLLISSQSIRAVKLIGSWQFMICRFWATVTTNDSPYATEPMSSPVCL